MDYDYENQCVFSTLIGLTLASVTGAVDDDRIVFTTDDGRSFHLYHSQDCCESVLVEDIAGEFSDLIGTPILVADEDSNSEDHPKEKDVGEYPTESFTYTYYKLATIKGHVSIRFFGQSNGYYSEGVSFGRCDN